MTRREWLELKSRVKINSWRQLLTHCILGRCCHHGDISNRYWSGGYYLKRSFIESFLPEDFFGPPIHHTG
jgi:hypothetical protein